MHNGSALAQGPAEAQGSTPRPQEAAHQRHSGSPNRRAGSESCPQPSEKNKGENFTLYCWGCLAENPQDTDKIYSLHEPHISCVAKGKEHKKYEFGTKASVAMTKTHGIIVAAVAHERNLDAAQTPA